MKKNEPSIKLKLFSSFAIFIAIILILLWLFQIIFLSDFYKFIKTKEVKNSATKIILNHDDNEYIENLAYNNVYCVMIIDENGRVVKSVDTSRKCIIHNGNDYLILSLIKGAQLNHGEYFIKEEIKDSDTTSYSRSMFTLPETVIYTKVFKVNNREYYLILNTTISPLYSTVETLRAQLLLITAIMVILGGILAWFSSKKVSKPIQDITKKAALIPKNEYIIEDFDGGYKEIDELSDTLDYAVAEINKTEKFRRELISNVSHDLRTPLTMITGYSEMIRDLPQENVQESIEVIIQEANRLTMLVNDMLDLAKYESGNISLDFKEFNLTKEVKSSCERLKALTKYNITFEYDREVFVNADMLQISQVLYNLIINAIHYTGEDLSVKVRQIIKGDMVRIEVIDTGEGIDKDKLIYIWDRYYKIDKTHKRNIIGSGIGLSIVKAILENHRAKFGADSEKGVGSTFYFELNITK